MISSTIRVFEDFPKITAAVEELAVKALDDAAQTAAATAANLAGNRASFSVIEAHGAVDGFVSGIRGNEFWAHFHDSGTLGNLKTQPTRPRKKPYKLEVVDRQTGATRPSGIKPLHFYPKSRKAGRDVLKARIAEGIGGSR
jgi:hypothetical protein